MIASTLKLKAILQSRWTGFLLLVPFLIMLAVHRYYGYSDALMGQAKPGEHAAYTYNLVMTAVFYLGVGAFIGHTVVFEAADKVWLRGKIALLLVYWSAILIFL